MKYNLIFFLFFLVSCTSNYTTFENREVYNSQGFALVYNEKDFENKIIKGKLNPSEMQISHNALKTNTLIKITNPKNNKTITLKNNKRIDYPDFYKILITKPVSDKLEISNTLPLVELTELRKNESFVAKKAKIFNEEKKISSNAPVASVKISNISKDKKKNKFQEKTNDQIYILIASFYSIDVAKFLKDRIIKEIPGYDIKKLIVKKKKDKEINLISGPYSAVNLMKNDYILLKNFGFEDLDITLNE
tara:strand:- start:1248 stop:1991 length:744 start_codon:yes stop_codon:yes gene_type:complete